MTDTAAEVTPHPAPADRPTLRQARRAAFDAFRQLVLARGHDIGATIREEDALAVECARLRPLGQGGRPTER